MKLEHSRESRQRDGDPTSKLQNSDDVPGTIRDTDFGHSLEPLAELSPKG
jgi:hypothetical protein